jgi:hypothetical protein
MEGEEGKEHTNIKRPQGAGLSLPVPDLGAAGSDVFGLGLLTSHRTMGDMEGGTRLCFSQAVARYWRPHTPNLYSTPVLGKRKRTVALALTWHES